MRIDHTFLVHTTDEVIDMRKKDRKQKKSLIYSTAVIALGCIISAIYANQTLSDASDYKVDLSELDLQDLGQEQNLTASEGNPDQEMQVARAEESAADIASVAGSDMVDQFPITDDTAQDFLDSPAMEQEKLETAEALETVQETEGADQSLSLGAEPEQTELSYAPEDKMTWPLEGDVIIRYSMDSSVYFETLGQYRYNPAIYIGAKQGSKVNACVKGRVTEIGEDSRLGQYLVMDVGSGYQVKYAQLSDLKVKKGDVVSRGQVIADVAKTTRYFSVEGDHLYLEITKDGQSVDPLSLLE